MNAHFIEAIDKVAPLAIINLTYALICLLLGIFGIILGIKSIDSFFLKHLKEIIGNDPVAISIFYGLLVLGMSLSMGIIVGLSCN